MSLAIFDLDNTLLRGDSDYAWGQFLVERHIVDGEHYERENQRYYDAYKAGSLDILEFLAFSLQPLANNKRQQLDAWHNEFMDSHIRPMITDAAMALVKKHRNNGDKLVIITATNSFVTRPIAREFGIDHLIATEPQQVDGEFTGAVNGTPCFREGKVKRINEWLATEHENLDGSWFYSDSHNDLPLLRLVDHPVAVCPDELLKEHAEKNAWPIVDLS